MKRSTIATLTGIAAVAAAVSTIAIAATQGTPGATSQGNVVVTAGKQPAVRISGLDDITFAASATTPTPAADAVCVFSNPGSYTITASSQNTTGTDFRLGNGTTTIAYSVQWFNAGTGGSSTDLASGAASPAITGAHQTSVSCAGGNTARIQVTIDDATYIAAPAGTYTDTLTLIVSPS